MKTLKKILAAAAAAVMAVSAMGLSASAEEVYVLDEGITMTLYHKGEELPIEQKEAMLGSAVNHEFSMQVPPFRKYVWIESLDAKTTFTLEAFNNMWVYFYEGYTGYVGARDITSGIYLPNYADIYKSLEAHMCDDVQSVLFNNGTETGHTYEFALSGLSTMSPFTANGFIRYWGLN